MDQQQQVSNSSLASDLPLKRKRGRPRKEKNQRPSKGTSYVPLRNDESQNNGENAPIPPGFGQANGNQPLPVDAANDNNKDPMIGQVVTGVIEATFEAGYLLAVRVGDSDTSLRGVVFKPGHIVPVSVANDVAPSLQMIRRNEVPIPSANQGKKRRGKQRSEHRSDNSPPSNQLARVRSKQMSLVPIQSSHPVGARGTVVPVVLQPVNISNGATPAIEAPPIASQPAHLASFKTKQPPIAQATEEAMPKVPLTDSGSASQPFEELISVAKRMQGSPESAETHNDSGASYGKQVRKDSGLSPEQMEDLSKPLLVKPLQTIRSSLPEQSAPLSHAFPERRTGKMTELLLAVQENLMGREMGENHGFKEP